MDPVDSGAPVEWSSRFAGDRRKISRYFINLEAKVRVAGSGRWRTARVRDISLYDLKMALEDPGAGVSFIPGTEIEMRVNYPGSSGALEFFGVTGKVLWAKSITGEGIACGVGFGEMDEERKSRWVDFMAILITEGKASSTKAGSC